MPKPHLLTDLKEAAGWVVLKQEKHLCPQNWDQCREQGKTLLGVGGDNDSQVITLRA